MLDHRAAVVMLAAVLSGPPGWAQSVTLSGSMGANKALLMIDGQPQMLAVGASARGVTLRRPNKRADDAGE